MELDQPVEERTCPLKALGTTLGRVRCERPALVERMKHSLSNHGQLTALVVVTRAGQLEILDGFKRYQAAKRLRWPELRVVERRLDETTQWAAMLLLNRGPQSMSILEESLVLKELMATGLTQVQIGQLVHRHKSWVSRRIGLVERLHPELVEEMKIGLLSAGVARRLLSLPAGNQLEMAAVVRTAQMGAHETEKLVGLWHRHKKPEIREFLKKAPRSALANLSPAPKSPPCDPRLSNHGQQLQRQAFLVKQAATRLSDLLEGRLIEEDLALLHRSLQESQRVVASLAAELGLIVSSVEGERTNESAATC